MISASTPTGDRCRTSRGRFWSGLVALEKAVAARDARIEALEAENAELRRRLGQTPRNSNMPPSAQGLDKPAPKSLRGRSGRRAGGQGGHEGRTLRQVEVPDETVLHEPAVCAGCGDGLADAAVVAVTRRQVFEIPQVTARIVEHRLVAWRCGCATVTGHNQRLRHRPWGLERTFQVLHENHS